MVTRLDAGSKRQCSVSGDGGNGHVYAYEAGGDTDGYDVEDMPEQAHAAAAVPVVERKVRSVQMI